MSVFHFLILVFPFTKEFYYVFAQSCVCVHTLKKMIIYHSEKTSVIKKIYPIYITDKNFCHFNVESLGDCGRNSHYLVFWTLKDTGYGSRWNRITVQKLNNINWYCLTKFMSYFSYMHMYILLTNWARRRYRN